MTKRATPLFSRAERVVAFLVGTSLILALVLMLLWRFVFVAIPPGYVGALYSLLGGGTVLNHVLPEGLAIKWPWNRIYLFEVRTQRLPYKVVALSAEGMNVMIEGATLFHPVYDKVPTILSSLGTDYRDRIVAPLTRSIIRQTVTNYNSNELYSVDHQKLQAEILALVELHPLSKLIDFDDVVITRISLPDHIANAIEDKLAQEQRAASYEFRLAAEKQEAERLRIQAIGIRNFYSIVSDALNDTLLTWRGIEATVQLAQSPNSKVVIVGGGKNQLPLILGSDIGQVSHTPKPVPPISGEAAPLPDWAQLPKIFEDSGMGVLNEEPATHENFLPEDKMHLEERSEGRIPRGGVEATRPGDATDTGLSPGVMNPGVVDPDTRVNRGRDPQGGIERTSPGEPSDTGLQPGVAGPGSDGADSAVPSDQ
ncbi:Regulator of protease activity HflC, stomatin/prohibitin superfamily [Tistlia consotensis]|uniref:Regulator of protease activity HflC, stomatin/prohibitin superfamily n=1 Tax=Tistlia consotensis USBA 355 TaxID=560819 RepID=A0A1Y6C6J5_9PROT|nr:prohibitin family protein [Tistlia consotensis]SMF44547.1 Regulator of protease activity HflC, stomatin/prohibitin superfamily [Tistlia consotensis USBA 355]SNR43337.1 Regulator of protease activity HflC, stomatin/prohibitin superfamily [Tistlia consotensis]